MSSSISGSSPLSAAVAVIGAQIVAHIEATTAAASDAICAVAMALQLVDHLFYRAAWRRLNN